MPFDGRNKLNLVMQDTSIFSSLRPRGIGSPTNAIWINIPETPEASRGK